MGQTNKPAETINQIIAGIVFKAAVPLAMTAIIAHVPWLGLPVIRNLLKLGLDTAGKYLYVAMANYATFNIIDHQIEKETKDYQLAEGNLRAAYLSGDKNAIEHAVAKFEGALCRLIKYDGSAPA